MSLDQSLTQPYGPLETPRLRLRRYASGEAELIYRLMSDPRVMRYYPQVYDMEQSRRALEWILAGYASPGYSFLAVERKPDYCYVGQVGLLHWENVDVRPDDEVAYLLLADHWGCGYATEAARVCRDWGFAHLGADRIVSYIDVHNDPSMAVARRNGMTRVKRLDENRFGKPIYVYAISRERWSMTMRKRASPVSIRS